MGHKVVLGQLLRIAGLNMDLLSCDPSSCRGETIPSFCLKLATQSTSAGLSLQGATGA